MIYVFDNNSLSKLKHFYPNIFTSVWDGLDDLFQQGKMISTREVWKEANNGDPNEHVLKWLTERKELFLTPTNEELAFVGEIFQKNHFQNLIGQSQILKGNPVADPFLIACAKVYSGTVVTEEKNKPNAAKIPNVCEHFNIPCTDLEGFMGLQAWNF